MIKSKNGRVKIRGSIGESCADLTVILVSFRQALNEVGCSEEFVKNAIDEAVTQSADFVNRTKAKTETGGDSVGEEN